MTDHLLARVGQGLLLAQDSIDQIEPPGPVTWSTRFAWDLVPFLAEGLWVLVQATVAGILLALVLGLVLALLRRQRLKIISWPTIAFIQFIRSTPLLVQLVFYFFVLPQSIDVTLSPLRTGILALGVHYATYMSESYRAGIESVPTGQWEGATAVNLSTVQKWRYVVLPQAIPTVIPALGNHVVAAFKDAPQMTVISVVELLSVGRRARSIFFRGIEPFTVVGIMFLMVSIPAAIAVRYLERRYGYERE